MKTVRSKGRFMKEKVLEKRLKAAKAMIEARRKKKENIKDIKKAHDVLEGGRIVDIRELAKNLECRQCRQILFLKDTVDETHMGLHSIFHITCTQCAIVNKVATGKTHKTNNNSSYCDVNTKAVLGSLHAGQGCTALNKLLSCLNIPIIHSDVYKRYERLVGHAIEDIAKDSCRQGALEEKELVIQRVNELCKEL